MPVSLTGEGDHRRRARSPRGRARGSTVSVTPPLRGELEGVREQVLQDLLQAVDVGEDRAPAASASISIAKREALLLGDVAEGLLEVLAGPRRARRPAASIGILPASTFDRSRISLMSAEEVVARGVDRLRELHLLRREVPVLVLGQHLRQDEQAVERRAQLVRHVREELGLVLGDELELLRLLLEAAARELDLVVLRPRAASPCRSARSACASSSALDRFSSWSSSSVRMRRGDHVQDDADGLHELIEEREVVRAERA